MRHWLLGFALLVPVVASAQIPRPAHTLGAASRVTCDNATMSLSGSPDTVQECLQALDTQAPPMLRVADCTTQTGVQKQMCQDSDNNSLYVCTTATCSAAGWATSTVTGHSIYEDGSEVTPARSVLNFKGRHITAADNAGTSRTDVTVVAALEAADCTAVSTGQLGDLCRDTTAPLLNTLWYCSDATCNVANEWKQMGSLALQSGASPAQNRLMAFGSANGQDVIVTNCSVTSGLNGIDCDANSTAGQSLVLKEDTDFGAHTATIGVGTSNLAASVTYGIEADGSIDFPASLQLGELGGTPSTPSTGHYKLYGRPQTGSGYPALRLLDDLGYVSNVQTDAGTPPVAGAIVYYIEPGSNAISSNASLFVVTVSTNDYITLDTAASMTSAHCDAAAEVGRLIVKTGAGVTDGTSGLCICAQDANNITWRCVSDPVP